MKSNESGEALPDQGGRGAVWGGAGEEALISA